MGNVDPVKKVHIDIARDAMTVTMRLEPGIDPSALNTQMLMVLLKGRQVQICSEIETRLQELLAKYEPKATIPTVAVVAVGTKPLHGVDGRLEITIQSTSPQIEAEADAAGGSIDHRARTSVQSVRAGLVIGRVHEPTVGRDGCNVFGQRLAAKSGKPVLLNLDTTVERAGDGRLIAVAEGVLDHRPPLLRVARELEIAGYVDFSTGNIQFPGNLRVQKGIRDCFEVKIEGDLTVHGLVEAATIQVEGNAALNGGMAARERGSLMVGRDLTARYLDNVQVHVGRDLTVVKEIINCRVIVGRKTRCEGCAISGGILFTSRECSIGQLGTGAVPTTVVLGRLAELAELSDQLEDLRPSITAWEERATSRLDQIKKFAAKLNPQQAEELTQLEQQLERAKSKAEPIDMAQIRLRSLMIEHSRVDLLIHKKICSGVTLWIGTLCAKVQEDLKGPIRITLDVPPHLHDPGFAQPPTLPSYVVVEDVIKGTKVELSQIARVTRHQKYEGPPLAAAA